MAPVVTFVTASGERYPEVNLPASLLKAGVSLRRREAYLKETGQIPGDSQLPEMQEPAEVVQQVQDDGRLSKIEQRLAQVESRPTTVSPSEESLQQWARSAERVGLAHAELAAVQEATVTKVEQVGADAQQRLDSLDSQQQALTQSVAESVSEGQASVAAAIQQLEQQSASALADIEAQALDTAQTIARQQRGPQGLAGAGVVIAPEDPSATDDESYGNRWFGRELVEGDGVLQVGASGITVWRRAGGGWLKSSELSPKTELVNQQLAVLDDSSQTTVQQTIVHSGGAGSGGGERLLINSIPQSSWQDIADSSNWETAGITPIHGGKVIVCVTDTSTGNDGIVTCDFVFSQTGVIDLTEYALTGSLFVGAGAPDVEIDGTRGNATIPAGVTGTPLPGSPANKLRLRVGANIGGSRTYLVSGTIFWAFPSEERVVNPGEATNQPLWTWA